MYTRSVHSENCARRYKLNLVSKNITDLNPIIDVLQKDTCGLDKLDIYMPIILTHKASEVLQHVILHKWTIGAINNNEWTYSK